MPVFNRKGFASQFKASTIAVDNCVSWTTVGVEQRGKVSQLFTNGTFTPAGSKHGFAASQAAPVVEVDVYEQHGEEWRPTGTKVIRPAMSCKVISDLRRPASFTGLMVINKDKKTEPDEIIMYGDIGQGSWWSDDPGITGASVREELKKIGKDKNIDLRMNSAGGDAFEGMAIYNILAQHVKKNNIELTVYNDGLVASAATVIAMAGTKIVAGQQSVFMIHRGWTIALGNRNDLMNAVELLDRIDNQTIDLYVARVNKAGVETKRDDMVQKVDSETYYDAQEQVDAGFADEIFETRDKVAAYGGERPWMHKLPAALAAKFSAPKSRVPSLQERAEAAEVAA